MSSPTPATIDDYIAQFPPEIQTRLTRIREVFHKEYPAVEESIRYNMPAFRLGKEHLYISAYKKHIGMYPLYGLGELESDIATFRGKGTKDAAHFVHARPLPLELIARIIKAKSLKR